MPFLHAFCILLFAAASNVAANPLFSLEPVNGRNYLLLYADEDSQRMSAESIAFSASVTFGAPFVASPTTFTMSFRASYELLTGSIELGFRFPDLYSFSGTTPQCSLACNITVTDAGKYDDDEFTAIGGTWRPPSAPERALELAVIPLDSSDSSGNDINDALECKITCSGIITSRAATSASLAADSGATIDPPPAGAAAAESFITPSSSSSDAAVDWSALSLSLRDVETGELIGDRSPVLLPAMNHRTIHTAANGSNVKAKYYVPQQTAGDEDSNDDGSPEGKGGALTIDLPYLVREAALHVGDVLIMTLQSSSDVTFNAGGATQCMLSAAGADINGLTSVNPHLTTIYFRPLAPVIAGSRVTLTCSHILVTASGSAVGLTVSTSDLLPIAHLAAPLPLLEAPLSDPAPVLGARFTAAAGARALSLAVTQSGQLEAVVWGANASLAAGETLRLLLPQGFSLAPAGETKCRVELTFPHAQGGETIEVPIGPISEEVVAVEAANTPGMPATNMSILALTVADLPSTSPLLAPVAFAAPAQAHWQFDSKSGKPVGPLGLRVSTSAFAFAAAAAESGMAIDLDAGADAWVPGVGARAVVTCSDLARAPGPRLAYLPSALGDGVLDRVPGFAVSIAGTTISSAASASVDFYSRPPLSPQAINPLTSPLTVSNALPGPARAGSIGLLQLQLGRLPAPLLAGDVLTVTLEEDAADIDVLDESTWRISQTHTFPLASFATQPSTTDAAVSASVANGADPSVEAIGVITRARARISISLTIPASLPSPTAAAVAAANGALPLLLTVTGSLAKAPTGARAAVSDGRVALSVTDKKGAAVLKYPSGYAQMQAVEVGTLTARTGVLVFPFEVGPKGGERPLRLAEQQDDVEEDYPGWSPQERGALLVFTFSSPSEVPHNGTITFTVPSSIAITNASFPSGNAADNEPDDEHWLSGIDCSINSYPIPDVSATSLASFPALALTLPPSAPPMGSDTDFTVVCKRLPRPPTPPSTPVRHNGAAQIAGQHTTALASGLTLSGSYDAAARSTDLGGVTVAAQPDAPVTAEGKVRSFMTVRLRYPFQVPAQAMLEVSLPSTEWILAASGYCTLQITKQGDGGGPGAAVTVPVTVVGANERNDVNGHQYTPPFSSDDTSGGSNTTSGVPRLRITLTSPIPATASGSDSSASLSCGSLLAPVTTQDAPSSKAHAALFYSPLPIGPGGALERPRVISFFSTLPAVQPVTTPAVPINVVSFGVLSDHSGFLPKQRRDAVLAAVLPLVPAHLYKGAHFHSQHTMVDIPPVSLFDMVNGGELSQKHDSTNNDLSHEEYAPTSIAKWYQPGLPTNIKMAFHSGPPASIFARRSREILRPRGFTARILCVFEFIPSSSSATDEIIATLKGALSDVAVSVSTALSPRVVACDPSLVVTDKAPQTCFDGVRNFWETETDCGVSVSQRQGCKLCDDMGMCNTEYDCLSRRCEAAMCLPPVQFSSAASRTPLLHGVGGATIALVLLGTAWWVW